VVSCYLQAGQAAKVLVRAISTQLLNEMYVGET